MQRSVLAEFAAVQQSQATFAVDGAVKRLLVGVAALLLEKLQESYIGLGAFHEPLQIRHAGEAVFCLLQME